MMSSSYSNPTILPRPELAATLPEADARALMELSDASEVRAWTQHKVEDYKNRLSTVLTIHNTIVPINTLPTEILQQIFTNVPIPYEGWCDALWMLSLGSVFICGVRFFWPLPSTGCVAFTPSWIPTSTGTTGVTTSTRKTQTIRTIRILHKDAPCFSLDPRHGRSRYLCTIRPSRMVRVGMYLKTTSTESPSSKSPHKMQMTSTISSTQ